MSLFNHVAYLENVSLITHRNVYVETEMSHDWDSSSSLLVLIEQIIEGPSGVVEGVTDIAIINCG